MLLDYRLDCTVVQNTWNRVELRLKEASVVPIIRADLVGHVTPRADDVSSHVVPVTRVVKKWTICGRSCQDRK